MAARFFEQEDRSGNGTRPSERVALVVGNSAYPHARLPNARNDARLIASTLDEIGFATELLTDVGKAALETAIVRLGERMESAGRDALGFFYFAGHGVQHDGVNFILPIDADLPDVRYLRSGAVPVDLVIDEIDRCPHAQATVVALDACRDNRIPDRSRGPLRGLASMRRVPPGTIVAFAAAADQIAEDGAGANGPFALSLAERLLEPGLRLDEVFFMVARDVARATDGAQQPSLFVQGAVPAIVLADDRSTPVEGQGEQHRAPAAAAGAGPPRASATPALPRKLALRDDTRPRREPRRPADRLRAGLGPLWSRIAGPTPRARIMAAGTVCLASALAIALLFWPARQPRAFSIDDPATWPVGDLRAVLWPRPAPCPSPFSQTPSGCFAAGWDVGTLGPGEAARAPGRPMALQIVRRTGAAPCPAGSDFGTAAACLIELPLHAGADVRLSRVDATKSAACVAGKGVLLTVDATPRVELCIEDVPPRADRSALAKAWRDGGGIAARIPAAPTTAHLRPRAWDGACEGLANLHYCLTVALPPGPDPVRRATHVVVINEGPAQIGCLYVAPEGAPQWGEDRLGKGTLPQGLGYPYSTGAGRGMLLQDPPHLQQGRQERRRQDRARPVR